MPRDSYYLPERRLVSQDDAAITERPSVPRSRFTGSKTRKTTFDAGQLIPFHVDEVLPGDHFNYQITAYVRLSTPLFPIFDNQRVDTFAFFIPARLVWTNWEHFMGSQDNPGDSIAFTIPQLASANDGFLVGSLFDHFGLPTVGQVSAGHDITVNALPLRSYNLVYNTWFRDQNLVNAAVVDTDDGPDTLANYTIRRRAKAHDYFNSALPWPQKFTAPTVPVGGLAPVMGIAASTITNPTDGDPSGYEEVGNTTPSGWAGWFDPGATGVIAIRSDSAAAGQGPHVYADLSEATGVAINTFRQAFMIQALLERDARGGTRYTELIRSHFGVVNPDFRLQRPEYIGGGQSPLTITPIAQTAPDSAGDGLGALGAAGTAAGQHSASYAATEHGYIIWLINVRSELSYQQGLHRLWTRSTRYDFPWPDFMGLGEQAILMQEIFANGNPVNDEVVFGYQERFHEYRTMYSDVTNLFRSTSTGNIDEWHLAQHFATPPTLNQTFIEDTPPMDRVLAAGSAAAGMQYLADIMIHRSVVRPISQFGTPVTLRRF